jgi:hypothetical protein
LALARRKTAPCPAEGQPDTGLFSGRRLSEERDQPAPPPALPEAEALAWTLTDTLTLAWMLAAASM